MYKKEFLIKFNLQRQLEHILCLTPMTVYSVQSVFCQKLEKYFENSAREYFVIFVSFFPSPLVCHECLLSTSFLHHVFICGSLQW